MKDLTCLRTIRVRRTSLVRFRHSACLAVIATFAGLLSAASPALAAQVVTLVPALQRFAVLGESTVTNTGPSEVTGDIGVSGPGTITGFPPAGPGTLTGTQYPGGLPEAVAAHDALDTAYGAAAGAVCNTPLTGFDLGTLPTLVPGVYCFTSDAQLTGTLVLDAQNDPNGEFIFQIVSALTTATNSSVVVINPSATTQVIWQIGSSASLGTGTEFVGNILAHTSISLATGASVAGRALALHAAVTMDSNDVSCGSCDGSNEIPGIIPPVAAIKVTGSGQIPVPNPDSSVPSDTGTGRANFGFNAQSDIADVTKGRLNYFNRVTGLRINGPVDDIVVIATNPDASPKTLRLSGTCGPKLPNCAFSVTVEDNDRRGTTDEFGITVTGAVSEDRSQRVLSRGNIRVR